MVPLLLFLILLVIAWPVFAIFGGTLLVVLGSHLHIIIPTVLISIVYLAILAPIAKRNNIKLGGKMGEALDPSKPIGPEFQKLMQEQGETPPVKVSLLGHPDQWRPVPRDQDHKPRHDQTSATAKPRNRKRAFAFAALAFVIAGPLAVVVLDRGMNMAKANGLVQAGPSGLAVASQPNPTREQGSWLVEASTDPIDDSKTVKISLVAEDTGSHLARPALVARCQSGITDVYVAWGTYVGAEPDFPDSLYRDVIVRIGEFPSDVLIDNRHQSVTLLDVLTIIQSVSTFSLRCGGLFAPPKGRRRHRIAYAYLPVEHRLETRARIPSIRSVSND